MPHRYTNFLITGGAGFIGSHITNRLLFNDFKVTVIDNLSTGRLKNIKFNDKQDFHFIKGDIRDFDLIKEIVKDVDVIFHEAALASVVDSIKDPLIANDINVAGTLRLLKTCLDSNVKRFILASSAAVYGDTKILPLKEDMTPRPRSPYAVSKLAAENYARLFYEVYGLETVCLRYFNVYGPEQPKNNGVISIFINQILNDQPPIIYGDGEQTRDFVYVQDVVDANILAMENKNAVGEILNIGTGHATSLNQLVNMLLQISGKKGLKPFFKNPRPGEIKLNYADVSKAKRILGYNPDITLKEGLTKLIEWKKNGE